MLADAYIRFRRQAPHGAARLEVAGYLAPAHQRYLADVQTMLQRAFVGDEFTYRGELDRDGKLAFLRSLDVLSRAGHLRRAEGDVPARGDGRGVPVVQPRRGAFVEIVERTGAVCWCRRMIPQHLADAFIDLCRTPRSARCLASAPSTGVRAHYTVAHSADRLLDVYRDVADRAQAVA